MSETLNSWVGNLSNAELIDEFIQLYQLVEVAECFNAKDFSRLLVVEHEIDRRGGTVSIALPHINPKSME